LTSGPLRGFVPCVKRAQLPAAWALAALLSCIFGARARAAEPDAARETRQLLTALDTTATAATASDPLAKARAAQRRAENARGAGDLRHATELDALALTWAQVADDLVRTAAAEKKLADLQKQVSLLEQKAIRTQALIEQTIARRGRAELNLSNSEHPASTEKGAPSGGAPGKEPAKTGKVGTKK